MLRVLRLVVATSVAVATLGLAGAPAGADGTGAVTGTLFDQSDAPLVGGTVGLLRDCGASCEETVTDASGQYLFEGLTPAATTAWR